MTSKTFLIKGGMIRFQIKRFWWISGFYALILFLATPFHILSLGKEYILEVVADFPERAVDVLFNDLSLPWLLIASVVLGICMFRYMQNVRSATLFHALPVKRRELYFSSLLSGIILLAVPILLNAIILFIMGFFGGYYPVLQPHWILDWIGGQLLSGTVIFCFVFFVGVLTGSSIAQLIFSFVFCFLPMGITWLSSYLLEDWLFGFTGNGMEPVFEVLMKIIPMSEPQFLCLEPDWLVLILQCVYLLLFSGLGFLLYRKRDTERAGDVAAFRFMRPLFLYGVTFCVMLVGVSFVRAVGGDGGAPNVVVALLFALLGYCVAKALLLKSFRILPYYKGYLVFAAVLLLAYSAIHFNAFGFGTTVPMAETIEKAYIGYHYAPSWYEKENIFNHGCTQCAEFADKESIEIVRSLQQEAISAGRLMEKEAAKQDKQEIYYSYVTKSGREITRVYYMEAERLFDLFSTPKAKDSMYQNIRVKPEGINYIEYVGKEDYPDIYGEKKEELLTCIRNDLDRLSYEEINKHMYMVQKAAGYRYGNNGEVSVSTPGKQQREEGFVHSLRIVIDNDKDEMVYKSIWFEYNENFTETVNWLKENGYMEKEE
ncbi:MAG: ABC transporter permease [Ruminococcaceae bacterium]|nr:ABC transporter permease [Oscillospiraceae bacterium]